MSDYDVSRFEEKIITLTPPPSENQVIFMWVSLVLGVLIGFLGSFGGTGRLIPGHPMHRVMVFAFDKVYGPFLNGNSDGDGSSAGLRMFVGLGEFAAGLGLIVGSVMYKFNIGGESLNDLNAALQLVAAIGLMCACLSAGALHKYVDSKDASKANVPFFVAIVCMVFIAIRMFILGPYIFTNQVIATVGGSSMLMIMFIAIVINNTKGLHESEVEAASEELKQIMDGKA